MMKKMNQMLYTVFIF